MPHSNLPSTHPTSRWGELVNAALLGMDRAQGVLSLATDSPWMPQGLSEEQGPVAQFLNEVAALANYELLGRFIGAAAEVIPLAKCEPSDRICRSEAASHLAQILHGDRGDLLIEWCHAAVVGGWRAPPELLPALLDEAHREQDTELRDTLMIVAGNRGAWLAGLNPQWQPLLVGRDQAPAVEIWATGTRDERLSLLRKLRVRDRDLAQRLVAEGWQAESAADRATMLQQFAENLGPSDEEWLETCLDDRSKQVREVAAQLLSQLTESAFAQRMAQRASESLQYAPARGVIKKKGPTIEVRFPTVVDAAMKRDTLGEKVMQSMGPNASLLAQIVGFAPLAVWDDHEPEEWIAAAMGSEWSLPLVSGWTTAAQSQQNARWSKALLRHVALAPADKKHRGPQQGPSESVPALVAALPPSDCERLALELLDGGLGGPSDATFDRLLACYTFPWSETLSRAMLGYLERRVRDHKVSYDYQLRTFLMRIVALYLVPSLAEEFADRMALGFSDQSNKMLDTILEVGEVLRFRRDLLGALSA